MSAAASAPVMPSHGTALPADWSASASACASVRLVMTISPTPCARRCCAVSVPISPAPTIEHAAAVEVAEDLPRERDRGEADRHRTLAERRLGAHALADARTPSGRALLSSGPAQLLALAAL